MIGPILKTGRMPAVPAAVCLVAGIGLGAWSVGGVTDALLLLFFSASLLVVAAAVRRERAVARAAFLLFWVSVGFLSGLARIALPAVQARAAFQMLPESPDRADRLEGVLSDFWSGEPPRARGRMRAERIRIAGTWHPFAAEVFLFVSGRAEVEPVAVRGDRVRLTGHLEAEDLPASQRDLPLPWPRYRLSVKSALTVEKTSATFLSFLTLPNHWLHRKLPPTGSRGEAFDRNVRGPLSALLLGRTSDLDRGMVARYRRGGLYHLLVVSGLHVVLAAGLVLAALSLFRVGGKRRDAILFAAVFLFVLVGGANPPAVRAGIVFAIFLACRLFERPITAGQAIGLSAVLLLLFAPDQIYSIGTVLTFAAVAGIALFTQPIRRLLPRRPRWLFEGLAAALAAEVATAPILFWRFNIVAAGAWLTAPLSVPLSGALIALGALLLFFFAFGLFPAPLVALFALGSRALETLAERAAGIAYLRPTPPLWAVLLVAALTLVAALARRHWKVAVAGTALLLFAFLALRPGDSGPARGFSLEALDVGQGDALLLRWGRHAVLVDGGGPFDLDARDFGRTRLLPKLLDRGVTRLDGVLLTHPHPDHALGLFAILQELPVGALWRSTGQDEGGLFAALEAAARERNVPVVTLKTGQALKWRSASLTVLHSGGLLRKKDGINNQSLVALFERDGRRALLTGDIGAATEEALLARGALRPAHVLKLAHHGSRTSTIPGFVSAVAPKAALLSCGRQNRFGHPHAETLETLSRFRIPVFRTDVCSDVKIELLPDATRLKWRGVL